MMKCNSCKEGFDGSKGNGYQPCSCKLKRPPTVEYVGGKSKYDRDKAYKPLNFSGFILGLLIGGIFTAIVLGVK